MHNTTRRNYEKYDVEFTCRKYPHYYKINFKQSPKVKYGFSTHFFCSIEMKDPIIQKDGFTITIKDDDDENKSVIFLNGRKKSIKFNVKGYESAFELSSGLALKIQQCLMSVDKDNLHFECLYNAEYKTNKKRIRTRKTIKSGPIYSKTVNIITSRKPS